MSNQDGIGNVAIGGPHANDNLSPNRPRSLNQK